MLEAPRVLEHYEEFLSTHKIPYCLTGSRVIGGYTSESDYDIVILDQSNGATHMVDRLSNLTEPGLEYQLGGSEISGGFESWKTKTGGETLNVIVCYDLYEYYGMVMSTNIAKGLQLTDKRHRVAMFEDIRERLSTAYPEETRGLSSADISAF